MLYLKEIIIGTIITVIFGYIYIKYNEIEQLKQEKIELLKNQEILKLNNSVLENNLKNSNIEKEILNNEFNNKITNIKETYIIIEEEKDKTEKIIKKIDKIKTNTSGYKEFFRELKKIEEEK